jgi:hypothetical protein
MNIPIERAVGLIGLNNNVTIDGVVVHIQTEDFATRFLLVTNVLVDGCCIHKVERNYAEHVTKVDFTSKLCRVAKAQHDATVQRVPEIWADYLEHKPNIRIADLQLTLLARVTWLFELGLKLCDLDPEAAEMTWRELLAIEPKHRKAQANLNRLVWARKHLNTG